MYSVRASEPILPYIGQGVPDIIIARQTALFSHIRAVADTFKPRDANILAFFNIMQFLSMTCVPPDIPITELCIAPLLTTTQTSDPEPILGEGDIALGGG